MESRQAEPVSPPSVRIPLDHMTLASRVHILLVLIAIAMLFSIVLKASRVVIDVLNWTVVVLVAIHAAFIFMAQSATSHKVIAVVLVVFALMNALWHQIEGTGEATAGMGGFVAGALIFSYFVFHTIGKSPAWMEARMEWMRNGPREWLANNGPREWLRQRAGAVRVPNFLRTRRSVFGTGGAPGMAGNETATSPNTPPTSATTSSATPAQPECFMD